MSVDQEDNRMFAISIMQPWVWAILHAGKRIENRGWAPPGKILGQRIAIHASKGLDGPAFAKLSEIVGGGVPSAAHLLTGGIVATAQLVGATRVIPIADPDGPCFACGERAGRLDAFHLELVSRSSYSVGPWCWVLEDVVTLPSAIPIGGRLGVWRVEEPFLAAVREQEALAAGAPAQPHVELLGQALADLPRSIRWLLPDGRTIPVPKSQILGEARSGALLITRWLASKLQLTRSPEIAP